jgi:hypothetical protein
MIDIAPVVLPRRGASTIAASICPNQGVGTPDSSPRMLLDAWMVEQDDIPGELAGWRSAG